MNEIIDQLIEFLKKFKKEKSPKNFILRSGMVNITAKINKNNKRITLYSQKGQTKLNFDNRKATTIRRLANCMMQAVKLVE